MDFQIHALSATQFEHLFGKSDEALDEAGIKRLLVEEKPGAPCRVSLSEAEIGDSVLLLNYTHQPANSPYRSSHAIFVRDQATQHHPAVNEVPEIIASRLVSVRMFDDQHLMIDADVVQGHALVDTLSVAFDNPAVSYVHLHFAKRGCFAASVTRACATAEA